MESQYGNIAKMKIAWSGVKTDFGSRLSPVVNNISDQLFNFLSDPGSYEIDFSALRTSISESGDLISERYGERIGSLVRNIMDTGADGIQITNAISPTLLGRNNFV